MEACYRWEFFGCGCGCWEESGAGADADVNELVWCVSLPCSVCYVCVLLEKLVKILWTGRPAVLFGSLKIAWNEVGIGDNCSGMVWKELPSTMRSSLANLFVIFHIKRTGKCTYIPKLQHPVHKVRHDEICPQGRPLLPCGYQIRK